MLQTDITNKSFPEHTPRYILYVTEWLKQSSYKVVFTVNDKSKITESFTHITFENVPLRYVKQLQQINHRRVPIAVRFFEDETMIQQHLIINEYVDESLNDNLNRLIDEIEFYMKGLI